MSKIFLLIANEPKVGSSLLVMIILGISIFLQKTNLPGITGLLTDGTEAGQICFGFVKTAGVTDVR